jgi:hypothetical protein
VWMQSVVCVSHACMLVGCFVAFFFQTEANLQISKWCESNENAEECGDERRIDDTRDQRCDDFKVSNANCFTTEYFACLSV